MEILSIPVKKSPRETPICEIQISYDRGSPLEEHWKALQLKYKKAPFWTLYSDDFAQVYNTKFELLRDLNVELIKVICRLIGIETQFTYSSELDLVGEPFEKTERVVNLCEKAGIDYLYDAKGAEAFLDKAMFEKAGIKIQFQEYTPQTYPQLYGEHIGYLSVVDMLFNIGPQTLDIIRAGKF